MAEQAHLNLSRRISQRYVMTFSPDSEQLLYTTSEDETFPPGHDPSTPHLVSVKDLRPVPGFSPKVFCHAATFLPPDGKSLVAALWNQEKLEVEITLLETQTGKPLRMIGSHKNNVTGLTCFPDGRTVATASRDGSVCLWPVTEGGRKEVLCHDMPPFTVLTLSTDGNTLAAGGYDMRVHLWNFSKGGTHSSVEHGAVAGSLGFSADGKKLVCAASYVLNEVAFPTQWIDDNDDPSTVVLRLSGDPLPQLQRQLNLDLSIPITVDTMRVDFLETWKKVADQKGSTWPKDEFDKTFLDLRAVTRHLEGVRFGDLVDHLTDERQRAGDKVEVIGLKIPLSGLRTYGIALLLGLQLYFWVHLRTFRGRAMAEINLGDEPWIGLYDGWTARVCFFLSAIVLPFTACIVLAYRGAGPREIGTWSWVPSLALSVCTLLEIVWAHRLRRMTALEISTKAYLLWQTAGCPRGQDAQNWKNAKLLLMRGDGDFFKPIREFFTP